MKTRELKELHSNISKLNNAFTHYTFVWRQFENDYDNSIVNNPNITTVEFFGNNNFSSKHRVKLKELPNENLKTNSALIEGIYVLVLTYFELYLRNIFDLSKKLDESILPLEVSGNFNDDNTLLDKVINRIKLNKSDIKAEYLLTYDYLRLKRNRIVHKSSTNISKTIRDLSKQEGSKLDSFWNNTINKGLQGIYFNYKNNINLLNYEILIDTLNILRIISTELDKIIINNIGYEKFLKGEILPLFISNNGKNILSLNETLLKRKLFNYCKYMFGDTLNDIAIQSMLKDISNLYK